MPFVHLNVHSQYSLLEGACRTEPLVKRAHDLGFDSLALTDHGVMYGAVEFYQCALKYGIKPIIGCEVNVAARTAKDKVYSLDSATSRLILLSRSNDGYHELIKIVSESFTEGFYNVPRVDADMLKRHSKGIIALSGGPDSDIGKMILQGDVKSARERAELWKDIFGKDNFFFELQDHGTEAELRIKNCIVTMSHDLSVPICATNGVMYTQKEDSDICTVLRSVADGCTVQQTLSMGTKPDEYYLKSAEQMQQIFADIPEACENAAAVAESCNVTLDFGTTVLPHFEIDMPHDEYLKQLTKSGLENIGREKDDTYIKRAEYELSVINSMGYTDYFLIVRDFVMFAKSNDIPVGPGRGSGAGSLVAYCIGITGIDPVKYDLIFERFLNPERVSMPDFDIDFCYVRRQEVIDYVTSKYGRDHVAQIVTFGTFAAKAALRDAGRVLAMPASKVDSVIAAMPAAFNITLEQAMDESVTFRNLYNNSSDCRKITDTAMRLEGMPRHTSTHAAGVVITRDPVDSYVPVSRNDDVTVTQYTMTQLEQLGLLKMDFLGLRTLTVIDDCVKDIRKDDPSFDIEKIDPADKKTFAMMSAGDTIGVFQFESEGLRRVLKRFRPTCIEDLTALTSLYRPGPMDHIDDYIENRQHPEKIHYAVSQLKSILDVTYGCIVYQEQVMQIFRELAGYSFGRADIVRRAMAKKKHDVMELERGKFRQGCKDNGISEEKADAVFDDMSSFASYAFNKSHAAAYAVIAYRTAYLKCNYTSKFMAALATSVTDNPDKMVLYCTEAVRMGCALLPPDVNKSGAYFTENDGSIRTGLLAVKNEGINAVNALIKEREENGPYISLMSLIRRNSGSGLTKKAAEFLVKSGALDCTGEKRSVMLLRLEEDQFPSSASSGMIKGQLGFFSEEQNDSADESDIKDIPELTPGEREAFEKEALGVLMRPAARTAHSSKQMTEHKRHGLFLRFDSRNDERIKKADAVLSVFDGDFPVSYYFSDEKKYEKRPGCMKNEPMLQRLRMILGDKNTIIQ